MVSAAAIGFATLILGVPPQLSVKGQTAQRKVVAVETASEIVEAKVIVQTSSGSWAEAEDITEEVDVAEAVATVTPAGGSQQDCNANGVDDSQDISSGTSHDWDNDGRPDECEIAAGDVNLDGTVNSMDLNVVLGWWNLGYSPTSDVNDDGTVDGEDLAGVLAAWGSTNP